MKALMLTWMFQNALLGGGLLTASQLAAYLRDSASITQAPADLTPALDDTEAWGPIIVRNGCQLSLIVKVRRPNRRSFRRARASSKSIASLSLRP